MSSLPISGDLSNSCNIFMYLMSNATTPEGKESGSFGLKVLSFIPENREPMARINGLIVVLVDLLSSGSDRAKENAAGALQALALAPENRALMGGTPGLFEGLVRLLISGSDKAKENAAGALWTLAFENPENRALMAGKERLIAGLVTLLSSGTPAAQENAARALWTLARAPENRALMGGTPGLLGWLVGLLISGSDKAKDRAAGALANLAFENPENQDAILQALLSTLSHSTSDELNNERLFDLFSGLGGAAAIVKAILKLSDQSSQMRLINKVLSKKSGDTTSLIARLFWEKDVFKGPRLLELLRSKRRAIKETAAAPATAEVGAGAMVFHGAGAPAGGGSAGALDEIKALEVESLYEDIRLKKLIGSVTSDDPSSQGALVAELRKRIAPPISLAEDADKLSLVCMGLVALAAKGGPDSKASAMEILNQLKRSVFLGKTSHLLGLLNRIETVGKASVKAKVWLLEAIKPKPAAVTRSNLVGKDGLDSLDEEARL